MRIPHSIHAWVGENGEMHDPQQNSLMDVCQLYMSVQTFEQELQEPPVLPVLPVQVVFYMCMLCNHVCCQ